MVSLQNENAVLRLFRRDIVELLQTIHPGFLRFPGGCAVEGKDLANAYNWKRTVGAPEQRKLDYSNWQQDGSTPYYCQSFRLGFYEYFLLSEYLGAKPLPVLNAGMACPFGTGETVPIYADKEKAVISCEFMRYIRDALDLIEFCNSMDFENSSWARLRRDMGHKESFGLQMIGIGNEQMQTETNGWYERYELFERLIHKEYPDIKLITCAGWALKGEPVHEEIYRWVNRGLEENENFAYMTDEHYYTTPDWMYEHMDYYDTYPRVTKNGSPATKIFLGEYAARWEKIPGASEICTLENALAEAAYLTMVERNSDLVLMAAYAPLLCRIGSYSQWSPNLIWYDGKSVYGTPSYYVQWMYANYHGDYNIKSSIEKCGRGGSRVYQNISASQSTGDIFIKIVNAEEKSSKVCFSLDAGLELPSKKAFVYTLTGKDVKEYNSIQYPKKLQPVKTLLSGISHSFCYTLPAHSVVIIHISKEAERKHPDGMLTVYTEQKGKDISPNLFGIFFEDINYSLDGGLYPELVQNKSFEYEEFQDIYVQNYKGGLYAWYPLENGETLYETATKNPIHENNPHYLKIRGTGVYNTGFSVDAGKPKPGMYVKEGEALTFSMFARSEDYTGPVKIRLANEDGSEELAFGQVENIGTEWTKYVFTMIPKYTCETARLEIHLCKEGTLCVDMVSLFPEKTWKNRKNGVRYDLGEMLGALKPAFLRFPGGCVVEGLTIQNRYRWKETVGPLEQRKNRYCNWGFDKRWTNYNQSYGFGFFDYFQLAEDLGAKAVPCINAGCSHAGTLTPIEEMNEIVQDAIDLGDFMNSTDMSNPWAKLRAEMGHSEPFYVEYMEIGNENSGSSYYERYSMIAEAMRKAHPEIKLIVCGGFNMRDRDNLNTWEKIENGELDADLIDEHYYIPNQKLCSSTKLYDNYKRNHTKIFVGEFASNSKDNNITDALSEAAYMTHLERNGDMVEMAAYAPLFAKENYMLWSPDLIYFSNTKVCPTVNYYVQKLFMNNTGDEIVPSEWADTPDSGIYTVVSRKKNGELIIKAVNISSEYKVIKIRLEGKEKCSLEMNKTVLRGRYAGAKNTLNEPEEVVPENMGRYAVNSEQEIVLELFSMTVMNIISF